MRLRFSILGGRPSKPPHDAELKPSPASGSADEFGDTGENVKDVDPDKIAATESRIAELQAEVEQLKAKHQRAIADYQNLSRRSLDNERESHVQGIKSVVQSIVPVLDHFDLTLGQDVTKTTTEQMKAGVVVIRDEMLKVLASYGVALITPKPGDAFDPMRHEAVMQAPATPGIESNHVVQCFQNGYAIGERTLRPAKVSVAV